MKTVVIFGGSGFVGRHIIRQIAKNGYKIIIPHQTQVNEEKLRFLGITGQIIPIKFRSIKDKKIINLIEIADVVINLKTLWNEKKTSFKKGILEFNIELINNIKKTTQFIFFSGIGVGEKNNSNRSDAIYKSEQYIQKNLINSIIIRSGVIMGGGDQFLKNLLPLFKRSFFIPLFGDGLSRFQPVFIDDISQAVKKIIETNLLDKHIFEFVGSDVFTYKELYQYLADCIEKTRIFVPISFAIAKVVVYIFEKRTFFPLNSEQLKLFENNNIASNKHKNFKDIGINPQDLKEIIKKNFKKNI